MLRLCPQPWQRPPSPPTRRALIGQGTIPPNTLTAQIEEHTRMDSEYYTDLKPNLSLLTSWKVLI